MAINGLKVKAATNIRGVARVDIDAARNVHSNCRMQEICIYQITINKVNTENESGIKNLFPYHFQI